jgi:arylsulfate sulfotransferase
MKANSTYHMRAVVDSADGQTFDEDHTFQTGAITPALVPQFDLAITPGQQPTRGVRLISGTAESYALNAAGDPIWYYENHPGDVPYLVRLLPNGHMFLLLNLLGPPASSALREVDLSGNTVRELTLTELNQKLQIAGYGLQLLTIDHDALVLPNGHWLFITGQSRVFTDLPGYPGQTTVYGTVIIDVDQNNNPVWVWDAFDHLDVNRHPMNFPDWLHSNALYYIPDDGSFLLSVRHQHWVLKIDYRNGTGAGDIIWRLGYQGDFTLLDSDSPADWFYAQHDANIFSPNLTGSFQLALMDNGDYRVLNDNGDTCGQNGQPSCYSTPTLFQVDENNMTARRMWSTQTPYSFWGGGTRLLSSSNVLFTESDPSDLDGYSSRIDEVTQTTNPTTIWKLTLHDQGAYRAEVVGSLYPGVQW